MKKLLTLVLGIVLFSGAAAAKLYWLPDYQNEDMKARDRVFDPENNRNDTCANDGMYDSPLSSNCYNCSVSASSSHKACYSCTAKPVPAGQVTKAVCYAKTNGSNGWIWTSSGICSGTEIYGTCTAKTCDSSYQTSATLCRTTGAYGWTLDTNDKCYAGARPNNPTATLLTATLSPRPAKAVPQSMAIANLMFVRVLRKVIVIQLTAIFLLQTAKVPA